MRGRHNREPGPNQLQLDTRPAIFWSSKGENTGSLVDETFKGIVDNYHNTQGVLDFEYVPPVEEGASCSLRDTAPHIQKALDLYLKASRLNGFVKQLEEDNASKSRINWAVEKRDGKMALGDRELRMAYGLQAMIAAGYNYDGLRSDMDSAGAEFYDSYTGPENENKRERFRTVLKHRAAPTKPSKK